MVSTRIRFALLGIVLAVAGVTPAIAEDEPRVTFSTSVNYSVGGYGTGKDTTFSNGSADWGLSAGLALRF